MSEFPFTSPHDDRPHAASEQRNRRDIRLSKTGDLDWNEIRSQLTTSRQQLVDVLLVRNETPPTVRVVQRQHQQIIASSPIGAPSSRRLPRLNEFVQEVRDALLMHPQLYLSPPLTFTR